MKKLKIPQSGLKKVKYESMKLTSTPVEFNFNFISFTLDNSVIVYVLTPRRGAYLISFLAGSENSLSFVFIYLVIAPATVLNFILHATS